MAAQPARTFDRAERQSAGGGAAPSGRKPPPAPMASSRRSRNRAWPFKSLIREGDLDPLDAIHFGVLAHLPGTTRPFELERVAPGVGGIEVGLQCPHRDALPIGLAQLSEGHGVVVRHLETGLLLEFPEGRGERVLVLVVLSPLGWTMSRRPSSPRTARRGARSGPRRLRRR